MGDAPKGPAVLPGQPLGRRLSHRPKHARRPGSTPIFPQPQCLHVPFRSRFRLGILGCGISPHLRFRLWVYFFFSADGTEQASSFNVFYRYVWRDFGIMCKFGSTLVTVRSGRADGSQGRTSSSTLWLSMLAPGYTCRADGESNRDSARRSADSERRIRKSCRT